MLLISETKKVAEGSLIFHLNTSNVINKLSAFIPAAVPITHLNTSNVINKRRCREKVYHAFTHLNTSNVINKRIT